MKSYLVFGAVVLNLAVLCGARAADDIDMGPDGPQSIPVDRRTGKLLRCRNERVLKNDFLRQLQRHEVYGSPNLIEEKSPALAKAAGYYREKSLNAFRQAKGPDFAKNLFSKLTSEMLFDGSKVLLPGTPSTQVPMPGDVLLNMGFATPWTIGSFYATRGMMHARIVVGTETNDKDTKLVVLDGGWKKFSKLSQIHSQTSWLRPRRKFFDVEERNNLIKWASVMEPVPYDNRLIDDLVDFRKILHSALDLVRQGVDRDSIPTSELRAAQLRARADALQASRPSQQNFAPFGNPDTFIPPTGNYCSEAGSHIFSYLGFRQYGETAFSLVTSFSPNGNLPKWTVYQSALTAFGASQGPVFLMHKDFFQFFSLMDAAWKKNLLPLPEGYPESQYNFSKVMSLNQQHARDQASQGGDLLDEQLDALVRSQDRDISTRASEIKPRLSELVVQLRDSYQNPDLNLSLGIDEMFFKNLAYGPFHFLENGEHFDLKGAFYNTDMSGGYQAKWVVNAGDGMANLSTTLYSLDPSASLINGGQECQVGGKPMGVLISEP